MPRNVGNQGSAGPVSLAGAYVGSVIGAGFASGREHAVFFLRFGRDGPWGIVLAGCLLMVFGTLFLLLAHRNKTRTHTEFLRAVAPPPVAVLIDGFLSLFVLGSLSVMMAGGGALVHALTGAPEALGAFGMAGATLALLLLRVERMLRVNTWLVAALVGMILWIAGASVSDVDFTRFGPELQVAQSTANHWPWAAALYASYNLALTLTLFGALGCEIRDVQAAVWAGVGGGAALTLVGLGVLLAISASPSAISDAIPMLHAARHLGPAAQAVYTCALALAMLTTTLAGSYTLTRRMQRFIETFSGYSSTLHRRSRLEPRPALHGLPRRLGYELCAASVIIASLPLSRLGFGRLVATLYPLIGYVGVICLALTALTALRKSTWSRS